MKSIPTLLRLPLLAVLLVAAAADARAADLLGNLRDLRDFFDGGARSADALAAPPPVSVPPAPGSAWVAADPVGAAGEGDVSAPDKLGFWARLQEKTFDGLCRQAEIPVEVSRRFGDVIEPGGKFHRFLRELPTGELAVIDEVGLSGGLGWLPRRDFDHGNLHANLDLSLGARLEGTSTVVRRLKTHKACAELKKLVDFRTLKIALPLSPERIAAMDEGEIWRLPLEFRVGVGGSGGDGLRFPLMIGLGAHRVGDVTATLRRLDAQTLRFRLRLERARVYDVSGNVNANIPVLLLGLPGASNVFLKLIAEPVAQVLNDYLAIQLDVELHRRTGIQQALEFLLDPRDPEQMRRLAEVLRGDLNVLALMKRTTSGLLGRHAAPDPWESVDRLAREQADKLGVEPSFQGQNQYRRVDQPLRFKVPFAVGWERTNSSEEDEVTLPGDEGSRYSVFRARRRTRLDFLDIPFLGRIFARDRQSDAQVVVRRDEEGKAEGPAIVFVQQEGFLREDARDAVKMIERADSLSELAGAHGEGTNAATGLPVDAMIQAAGARYRKGVTALTLLLNEPAVRDILAAGTGPLVSAYVNTLTGPAKLLGDWLLSNVRAQGGTVRFDGKEARAAALRIASEAGVPAWRMLWDLYRCTRQVAALTERLAQARQADTAEAQAKALATLFSGRGWGKPGFGNVMRVLVQLADPLDISGEFLVDLAGRKGRELRSRYLLNPDGKDQELLDGAAQATARFRPPTVLND